MDFDEYQDMAAETAIYKDVVYPYLGLAEEAGEVCSLMGKSIRDDTTFNTVDMKKECGDVLWMLSQICTDLGISLSDVAKMNIEKLHSRMERGVLGGSGDNR